MLAPPPNIFPKVTEPSESPLPRVTWPSACPLDGIPKHGLLCLTAVNVQATKRLQPSYTTDFLPSKHPKLEAYSGGNSGSTIHTGSVVAGHVLVPQTARIAAGEGELQREEPSEERSLAADPDTKRAAADAHGPHYLPLNSLPLGTYPTSTGDAGVSVEPARGPGYAIIMGINKVRVRVYRNGQGALVLALSDCVRSFVTECDFKNTMTMLRLRLYAKPGLPFFGRVLSVPHIPGRGHNMLMVSGVAAVELLELYREKCGKKVKAGLTGMDAFLEELRAHVVNPQVSHQFSS